MANCFIRTVKGNYYIVVKLDDGTSQSFSVRKELGLKRKATVEAKELLRRKMNELADGGLIKSGDITVGRFMSDWLEIKKASIKEGNLRQLQERNRNPYKTFHRWQNEVKKPKRAILPKVS